MPLQDIVFNVTFRCNLHCKMCGYHEIAKTRHELSTAEVLRGIKGFPELGTISFSGGEPTLRGDLLQLMLSASKKAHTLNLSTNGILTNKIIKLIQSLQEHNLQERMCVTVSLDGAKPETHNGIRGVRGAMERSIETLEKLEDLGVSRSVSMTIMSENINEVWNLYNFCRRNDLSFFCRLVSPRPELDKNMVKALYSQLKLVWEDMGSEVAEFYLRGIIHHAITGKRPIPCYTGRTFLEIDAFGDAYPCMDAPWRIHPWKAGSYGNQELVMGNITENPLTEIINLKRAEGTIDLLDSEHCNKCWMECSFRSTCIHLYENPSFTTYMDG